MGDFATTFNELVDAHTERKEDVEWLKAKMADLKEQSRCNKVNIYGTPETIQLAELRIFFIKLISTFLPSASQTELILDQKCRLKLTHLPDKLFKYMVVRIHFCHIKDKFL